MLDFRPDDVIRSAERIDDILRGRPRAGRRRRRLSRGPAHGRPTVHGLAVVDKPAGVTSHDVVGMLRRRFGERRIGHAGTLDPSATGVLVVGVGDGHPAAALRRRRAASATPARSCSASRPTRSTPTARSTATHDMAGVTVDDARRGGRRAPRSATSSRCRRWCRRSGSTAGGCTSWPARASRSSAAPRPVTVDRFDVAADRRSRSCCAIEVDVLGGTYVRTLAADLGHLLGGGAHLRNLRRTAVGPFTIAEAAPPDDVRAAAADRGACARMATVDRRRRRPRR